MKDHNFLGWEWPGFIRLSLNLLFLAFICFVSKVWAAPTCESQMRGINLVPLPSGWYKGAPDLVFPMPDHIAYYRSVGMNAIRLPLAWEALQPVLFGELNLRYLIRVFDFLDAAELQGMRVLIDLHNYGRYQKKIVGTPDVPADAFGDVWARIAKVMKNKRAVYAFGLMNEPHDTQGYWHKVAQAGVDGVRSVDMDRWIYVAGESWSNSQRWPVVNPETFVSDIAKKVVYEAHTYFDDDFSGRYRNPVGNVNMALRAEQRLQPFLDWLRRTGQKGAIGEFGVPMDDPRWIEAQERFLDLADAACLDWFVWAGGGWRPTYELSMEPIGGRDRPQMTKIRERLAK
ncbi:glycoside hydrolase family 5 protein [Macromonas nakdongensis]|uniref:glycoside hydrolase family 5 protein n=1 Tax=Macromonas nakdongensis TaxID=1843082 RepID=UPI000C34A662|nr:glycoside hydrolase family 5 protein [Macromonas nakdongensis]